MALTPENDISADLPFEKRILHVLGSDMAYVDTGSSPGSATIFLHGNPTSSYLWRNIIPHVYGKNRYIAPDLIGFGDSGKVPGLEYRVADHQKCLDAFLDAVLPTEKTTLVLHDWGSAIGFDWARRHENRVAGLTLMEFMHPSSSWETAPKAMADNFKPFREPKIGRELIIDQNVFIERILPGSFVRPLSEQEMTEYRRPFLDPASREPLWRFPNEIPIGGQPDDVAEMAEKYMAWLFQAELPKLFFWVTPGGTIGEEKAVELMKKLRNTRSVYLGPGVHFVQEDHPRAISREISHWLPLFSREWLAAVYMFRSWLNEDWF
ncbi:Alpha/Beta hydrolase protein [Colletotrichum phormii]|uniref:haloalkane dehalogenase n=1 Tax=Colletotrichum phormii TaxID=359342 RepID=A0AAJ0EL60_9PEZI|nr:Alpha/Beta hydrolase protein [Colletotrichum phormii]KAK1655262.1 Alpha/Beta hydrolase protein [Colletotrichum phormii]